MSQKILIVDDEAHIRRLLERTLLDFEDNGVMLLMADNGSDALRLIQSEKPDLVFLDVMMPQINGFEICQKVKHELGLTDMYIVMLTAKGQEFDKVYGLEVGADVYLTKPFDPDAIIELTNTVLSR